MHEKENDGKVNGAHLYNSPMGAVMLEVLRYFFETSLIVKLNKGLLIPPADI